MFCAQSRPKKRTETFVTFHIHSPLLTNNDLWLNQYCSAPPEFWKIENSLVSLPSYEKLTCSFLMRHSLLNPKQSMLWVSYRPGGVMSAIPCLTSFISDSFLSCLSGFNLESNSKVYNNHFLFLKSTKNIHSTEQQWQTPC